MQATLILCLILNVKLAITNDVPEVLKNYQKLVDVIGDLHTYDPRTKTEISEAELLSYRKPGNVYPALGVAVTNNQYSLDPLMEEFKNITANIKKLQEVAPNNPFVRTAVEAKEKAANFFQSLCNFDLNQEAKFILTSHVVSSLRSITVGTLKSASLTGIVGGFDEQEEKFQLMDELNQERKIRDEFFNRNLADLKDKATSLEDRLEINEQSYAVENHLTRFTELLQLLVDPQTYSYKDFNLIGDIQARLMNNTMFTSLLEGNRFGLEGKTALMTLSDTESSLLTEDDHHQCSRSHILTKFTTVIPNSKVLGKQTEDKYRYSLPDNKSLYVNPAFLMTKSKFRPHSAFSTQRTIIADDRFVQGVLPYNNTVIFVNTVSDLGEITRTCKNFSMKIYVYEDPVFELPHGCSLTGKALNISTFQLIYTHNEITEDVNDNFNFGEDLFSPMYHKEDHDRTRMEEYEMEEKIHKIFNLNQRVTQIERDAYRRRDVWKKIGDKMTSVFYGGIDMLKTVEQELVIEPFYQICSAVGVLLIIILFILIAWRKCK